MNRVQRRFVEKWVCVEPGFPLTFLYKNATLILRGNEQDGMGKLQTLCVGTIYLSEKQKILLRNQYETAHSKIEQDMMLWGGCLHVYGENFLTKGKPGVASSRGKTQKQ